MKNQKIYSILIFLSLSAASCKKNYLDRTPGVALDEAHVFADPILAAKFADNAYTYRINDYARFNDHRGSTSQASDEAVSGNSEGTVTTLNTGNFFAHSVAAYENDIGDVYSQSYAGIAIANKMLDNLAAVPVTTAAQAVIFPKTRVEGEMHFLRAFFYFELVKRFGGVPLLTKTYGVNDDVNIPRSSYDDCVAFILSELDKAQALLLNEADYGPSNIGRANKPTAMALRARVLLYAASPLNNASNDKTKWKAAADAAQAVMNLGIYSLQATYNDILNLPSSSEYIQIYVRGPRAIDGILADYAMSPAAGGAQGQMDPTQNHVDMYQMLANGKDITDPTSGYDPQHPYDNRDPRFKANIIYNSRPWQGATMDTWTGVDATGKAIHGKDYDPSAITYTATRYYCRKYWPEVYNRTTTGTTLINFIYFRYAEILLNYAEAQNEYLDAPDASVYTAINQVRQRMHVDDDPTKPTMPPITAGLTQAQMRVAIRHERAIELAFEDHRWYDIMRWKIGTTVLTVPMTGMNVIKNLNGTFTYTPIVLGAQFQKQYQDYFARYPFPRKEIQNSLGVLVQNPGWN